MLGIHLRPRDDGAVPDSPRGSELLYGLAAGARFRLTQTISAVFGPEVYGETALQSLFRNQTTGAEWLLTGRVESFLDDGLLLRGKLGAGTGLHQQFGSPEWRTVISIEIAGRAI